MTTARATDRLLAVRPQLTGVATAAQALGLRPYELLHAGPPLADARRPPPVLRSSAVVVCRHEGWADDDASAQALIDSGTLQWSPAQDRGVVTPLAALVSAGTPLFEVADAAGSGLRAWAPVSAVRGPDTRMGFCDPGLAARLALRDHEVAPAWQAVLAAHGPLALYPLAQHGLADGDDLHSRTAAATQALAEWLRGQAAATLASHVEATPLFFLTLWMAACSLVLRAAEGADRPTLVTRAGGNGEAFGIAVAGAPGRWIQVPAAPPRGRLLPGVPADAAVCGAIGDSAVIDLLGFGAQRLASAPEPLEVLGDFLPLGHERLAERLLLAPHPAFAGQGFGLDARQVVAEDAAPLVALAMLAADGQRGFVGRGVYRPPVALFRRALDGRCGAAEAAPPTSA